MAHFYGTVQGGRGEAARCGHKSSGLRVTAASYTLGAEVRLSWSDTREADTVCVRFDGGSGGSAYAGSVDYFVVRRDGEAHSYVEPNSEFFACITDHAWQRAFSDDPALADRLRTMLIFRLQGATGGAVDDVAALRAFAKKYVRYIEIGGDAGIGLYEDAKAALAHPQAAGGGGRMNPIQSRIKLTQPPEFPRPWRAERVRNTVMVWVLAADGTPVCAVPCMETALIIARAPEVAGALEDILTGELVLTRDEDAALARAALHRV